MKIKKLTIYGNIDENIDGNIDGNIDENIDGNIDENDHLKDMIDQHQHAIKELQKQIEELEFQLTKSSTLPEKKKSFLWTFFDTD